MKKKLEKNPIPESKKLPRIEPKENTKKKPRFIETYGERTCYECGELESDCDCCVDIKSDRQTKEKIHSGEKYIRRIYQTTNIECKDMDKVFIKADVYDVLSAFQVNSPPLQHAIKKLLCCGIRGKGDFLQDLKEAKDSVERAIEQHENGN